METYLHEQTQGELNDYSLHMDKKYYPSEKGGKQVIGHETLESDSNSASSMLL
jgi:hypothetical protein